MRRAVSHILSCFLGGWQREDRARRDQAHDASRPSGACEPPLLGATSAPQRVAARRQLERFTQATLEAVSRGAWAAAQARPLWRRPCLQPMRAGAYTLRLPSGVQVVLSPSNDAEVTAVTPPGSAANCLSPLGRLARLARRGAPTSL